MKLHAIFAHKRRSEQTEIKVPQSSNLQLMYMKMIKSILDLGVKPPHIIFFQVDLTPKTTMLISMPLVISSQMTQVFAKANNKFFQGGFAVIINRFRKTE